MKLIDILNMISKGKLKEGTKVKYNDTIYKCKEGNVFDPKSGVGLLEYIYEENLNDEVEIIEPEENIIEKIEELDVLGIGESQNIDNLGLANSIVDLRNEIREIQHKLNEVIRRINNVR